jgi:hypothetical protein
MVWNSSTKMLMRDRTAGSRRACSATPSVTRFSSVLPINAAALSPTRPRAVLTITIRPSRSQAAGSTVEVGWPTM